MTVEEKNKRKEDFIMWVTFLPDRVKEFKQKLPSDISNLLDESPDSLEIIETYILNNYSVEYFQNPQNKDFVNGFVSYIGEVFQKNLPNAKWFIELDDEINFCFALPSLKSDKLMPICIHRFLPPMFHYKKYNYYKSLFDANSK